MNAVVRSGSDLVKCLEVLRRTDSLGTLKTIRKLQGIE